MLHVVKTETVPECVWTLATLAVAAWTQPDRILF